MDRASLTDRISAALFLAGTGNALGAQTERWTIDEIERVYGGLVLRFAATEHEASVEPHSIVAGELSATGSQMYYLARALITAQGRLGHDGWVRCLLDWALVTPQTGNTPGTGRIVNALRQAHNGSNEQESGRARRVSTADNSNEAAVRVAPCGLIHPGHIEAACAQAFITCLPSHDTDVAIAAACAIAAGVSEALVRPALDDVLIACIHGAQIGEQLGKEQARCVAGPRLGSRMAMAVDIACTAPDDRSFLRSLEASVGNSSLAAESVAAAIGVLAYAKADPLHTIALATSIGNDTKSIATMAGALAGAMCGTAGLPTDLVGRFRFVNEPVYDITSVAAGLTSLALRTGSAS